MRRIAMWSGPRNISTALLRAFENRTDACVIDEPLYAYYLNFSGKNHPGRDEIIASYSTDYKTITEYLAAGSPGTCDVFYQKQMAHHLRPEDSLDWLLGLHNVFLIRDPQSMLISLSKVLSTVALEDTGLPQQMRIAEVLRSHGKRVVALDSRTILEQPRQTLQTLCAYLQLSFDDSMLSWPPGPRASDGIWSKYWYDAVLQSTGFAPFRPKVEKIPAGLRGVLAECEAHYDALRSYVLV